MKKIASLSTLSPLDGRYSSQISPLTTFLSEFALLHTRIKIEILYLQFLSSNLIIRKFTNNELKFLKNIDKNFSLKDAQRIKKFEEITLHDVKAIEYFLKEKFDNTSLKDISEMIHIGLTSEDVSNLAWNLCIKSTVNEIILPNLKSLIQVSTTQALEYKAVAMLSRTHGKGAPATTAGKEIALFAYRLAEKYNKLTKFRFTGKLSGVVGNYHDLTFAFPNNDWIKLSQEFIANLDLEPLIFTTQIEPHDRWAELLHLCSETASIIQSMDQNMWLYISYGYFHLPPKKGQIGSSVMPHKGRNPIGFENSEGNAILALNLFDTLAKELPQSRLQRHLSDTTLTRNIGTGFGYLLLALQNAQNDIKDLQINHINLQADLDASWGSVTSGLQTKLRMLHLEKPYERIDIIAKEGKITKEKLITFIEKLPIDNEEKSYLLQLNPKTYTGKAEVLTKLILEKVIVLVSN